MLLFIIIGILALVAIIGTLVVVPAGQDSKFADRQRYLSQYNRPRTY